MEKGESQENRTPGVHTDRVPIITCSKCGCEIDVADLEPFVSVECPDCSNIDVVPAKLGPFLLLNLIGTGGMGAVYYAKDQSLGRFVAIKVMLKSIGENREFFESFKREAQAVARLNHPSIVQIYSFGEEKNQPYIVMELVSGQRFDKMVETKRALDQALVMRVGLDIAEGLRAADEAGLLHGDIKPENILLDEKMHAKLVDFGIATFANQGQSDGIWGTPYYIAPEKIRRQKPDCRSDIYSLGATLFHALAGRPPFEGKTPMDVVKARLNHPAPSLHSVRHDCDPLVDKIVARMLEGDQSRRYPNYGSLISDMRKVVQQLGSPGAISGFSGDVSRKTGKVFVPKKRNTVSEAAPAPEPPPPQPTRLVIHKKQTGVYTSTKHETRTLSPKSSATKPKPQEKSRVGVVMAVLLIIGIIVGCVALWMHFDKQKKQKLEIKRESLLLKEQRGHCDEAYRKVIMVTSNVIGYAKDVSNFVNDSTNAVFAVLGEPLDLPDLPAVEEPVEAAAPQKPPEAPAPQEPANLKSADGKSDIPPGVEGKVPLFPQAEKLAPPPKPVEDPKPVVEAPKEPPKPREPPKDEPQIKVLTRKIIESCNKIETNAVAASELEAAALTAKSDAAKAVAASVAAAQFKLLDGHLARAQMLDSESKSCRDEAQKAFKQVLDMKAAKESQILADAKEKEEAEKQRLAAEADQRKAQELRVEEDKEVQLVEATRANNIQLLKQHKYKDMCTALAAAKVLYKTAKGKDEMQILIDRATRLEKMKTFVVQKLTAEPFKWGFMVSKNSSVDVLGADDNAIKLKDRSVPWAEISTAQMLNFVNHYIQNPRLPVRVQGDHNLNAAVFCFENGGTKAAKTFSDKAIELCPDLKGETERLMPGLE